MLNLIDPPESEATEEHPHLRLVPDGPPVSFRVPQDPQVHWMVRAVAIVLGVVISTAVVTTIIFAGSFIKYVYDTMDAADRARATERREAVHGPDGSIRIVIPKEQPTFAEPAVGADGPPDGDGPVKVGTDRPPAGRPTEGPREEGAYPREP
jgi:hypothetical protein